MANSAAFVDKYRPRTVSDFVGLDKPKRVLGRFAEAPRPCAFLFVGPPGTGKTTMAQALADQIGAEVHLVPSRECDLERVRELYRISHFAPMRGAFHLIIVDEADQMTAPAQLAFLSKLDSTAPFPHTVVIFTANATDGLEKRFLSRCLRLDFSSYGMADDTAQLLANVWQAEAPNSAAAPDFRRIVKESTNNIRDALNRLELEVMAA